MYDAIIYEATYGRTLTIKWLSVPHPCPMTLIFKTNITTSYAYENGTAQSQQIITFAKLPT